MADVRALLKAKRQEARVTHPYATYNASGALRCAACGAAVKFASAWEGHLGSKAHRVAVANLKAKEEAAALLKRSKAEEQGEDADEEMRVEDAAQTRAGFPADFFSDPSRAPPEEEDDEDEADMDGDGDGDGGDKSGAPPKSQFDVEWAAFERDMQSLPPPPPPDPQETYARATVAAEPELVPGLEGLPGQAAPEGAVSEQEQKVSAGGERRRKQQEEHELIMDRLLEEERAQEEADSRVAVLKSRVEMLKKKRELAKAKGTKATVART